MRKVLITGGNGKLGRFVRAELAQTSDVTVFDRVPSGDHARSIVADVRDVHAVERASHGQNAIVHLAGIPNPRHPLADETMAINVLGTWSVMQAALLAGVQRVVFCSSDCATGLLQQSQPATPLYLPIDEAHPVAPMAPYGLSKHLAEQIVLALGRRDIEVVILRPGLIVFPGMKLQLATAGVDPHNPDLWWYGSARDVAHAFRLALDVPDAAGRTFFVGAANTFSSRPTLELVTQRYGQLPEIRRPDWFRADPHAALFDTTLARQVLGFSAQDDWRHWITPRGAT